ncbi:MAG: FUN14 domain-containing protein [Planctomycetota bacterium]
MSDPAPATDSVEQTSGSAALGGSESKSQRSLFQWFADMPLWEKILLLVALAALVGGGVWSLMQGDAASSGGGSSGSGSGSGSVGGALDGRLGASFIEGGGIGGGSGSGSSAAEEPASKGFFRIGFSFLAGFCIGAFLRATLKIAAIAVGFWLLMTFVLSYVGIVVVDWSAMDGLWNRFTGNVESEWGNFQQFMLGSLPATGLAVTGFAVGLKRH